MVLSGKDIARTPTHLGAQRRQGFDQHRRLDRHVQAAGNARVLQRLLAAVFAPQRHESGHFGFANSDLLAAPVGQSDVLHLVVGEVRIVGFDAGG